jgi:hypothetical protein
MFRSTVITLVLSLATVTANASLLSRAGGQAHYDTDTNLTWVADANLACTQGYPLATPGSCGPSGVGGLGGRMDWATAVGWAASLNTQNGGLGYLGISDWRLPTVIDTGASGCDFGYSGTDCGYNVNLSSGEMAHLFYSTLGNIGRYDTAGGFSGCSVPFYPSPGCLASTGPFSNLQPRDYWTGMEYALSADRAWLFYFHVGYQDYGIKANDDYYAWAVHDGDPFAVVTIPPTLLLFGSSLPMSSVARS